MGINATLETLSLSGKKAKRRTINCSSGNLLNCYIGNDVIVKSDCNFFGNGLYIKIGGDPSQPSTFTRTNSIINYGDGTVGDHESGDCVLNGIIKHYNINKTIMSTSRVSSFKYISGNKRTGKTLGVAYSPKFSNTNYVGKYVATHTYTLLSSGQIEYTNIYNFENGNTSSATYTTDDSINLKAITKLQATEALIKIEIEKQTAVSEFGFIDAELGYNLKKIRKFKTLLTNNNIDTYGLSNNFLKDIENGIPIIVATIDLLGKAIKGDFGNYIAKLVAPTNIDESPTILM